MRSPPTNNSTPRESAQPVRTHAIARVTDKELARRRRIAEGMRAAGISVAAWAKAHQFNHQIVSGVLNGRFSGARGEAHAVCVALKLKRGATVQPADFDPAAALGDAA